MKTKSKGISLIIALAVSLFLSGMTVEILRSVATSLEQSQNLERSNQVFLAAESGLEAAFFHHNSRGQGVDFGDIADVDESQKIFHSQSGAEVSWTIKGRKSPIVGVLHEGEKVSIPFFWDDAKSVNLPSDPTNSRQTFTLEFSRNRFNENGDEDTTDELVPQFFDFGNSDGSIDEPLIAWSLSRTHQDDGIQSLISVSPDATEPCASGTAFLCKDQLFTNNISSANASLIGNVVPGLTEDNLSNFLSDLDSDNFRFSFQSLLPFTNEAGDKTLEGIPYKITFTNPLPAQSYTATAKVDVSNFSKTISVTIPEKQSIGAFDYLVLD